MLPLKSHPRPLPAHMAMGGDGVWHRARCKACICFHVACCHASHCEASTQCRDCHRWGGGQKKESQNTHRTFAMLDIRTST
jgi:hypothetical protein